MPARSQSRGASCNLFQYLEREKTKELVLPAFFPTVALSFSSPSSSLPPRFRFFVRWSIGLSTSRLYHCLPLLGSVFIVKSFEGETRRREDTGLPAFTTWLESFQSRQGNSVSQIAPRERKGIEERGREGKRGKAKGERKIPRWIFQGEMFRMLFAEGSVHSRVSSNSRAYANI